MRIDLDTYREIVDTITRNKARSFLTGFGVFWGVFMLVALMGGGQGLKEMLEKNFEGFAQNTAMIWAQQTTKPYKGFHKGRWWAMEYKDIERLRRRVPELDAIAPVLFAAWGRSSTAYYGDQKSSPRIQGVTPEYADIVAPRMYYGRYINEMDMRDHRKVCVLGKKIYKELFKEGGDPCGKTIRIDSTYYEVVGVDYNASGGMNFNGRAEEKITLPLTLVQQTYNRGNEVDLIAVTGRKGVVMSKITPRIRETIARAHYIDPTDEQGAMVFNSLAIFFHKLLHRAACHIHALHCFDKHHVALRAFCHGCFAIFDGYLDWLAVDDDGTNRLTSVSTTTYHGNDFVDCVHIECDNSVVDLSFGNRFTAEHVVEERGFRVAQIADNLDFSSCLSASHQADSSQHTHE